MRLKSLWMRVLCVLMFVLATAAMAQTNAKPKIDIQYLVNGRRPIWMGPAIRYTVYMPTVVEARIYSLGGEIVHIYNIGEQQPGVYTVPFDGTLPDDPHNVVFDGKYYFELFFGDEYATKFWIICKPLDGFSE